MIGGRETWTEDRLRLVIDTIPTMAWSLEPDGTLDFVNQRWLDYTGLSFQEAIEDSKRIVHPEDLPRAVEKWLPKMATGMPSEGEIRLRRADGEYRWFLVRTVPLRDEDANVVEWYGTSTDIEDRKRAEMAVRTLIDAIPQQIWSAPPDGKTDYCNDRWRSYTGLELEDVQGYGWQTMVHPDDRERVLKAWRESVASGTPYEQEERHRATDGSYRWFLSLGVPLRDAEGRIVRWYGTNTDIEDRKQAENALNAQALRYKTLMETSTDSIYVVNENGDLQEANAAFLRERGYTAAEMKDLNIADWDTQWDREQIRERNAAPLQRRVRLRCRGLRNERPNQGRSIASLCDARHHRAQARRGPLAGVREGRRGTGRDDRSGGPQLPVSARQSCFPELSRDGARAVDRAFGSRRVESGGF
jgi:PAS domain S-box-containing protein